MTAISKRGVTIIKNRNRSKTTLIGALFVLPMMLGTIAFYYIPIFQAFIFSFQNVTVLHGGEWVGLQNYRWVVQDPRFWQSVQNTFSMGLMSLLLNISIPLIIASLLNFLPKGKNLFRTLYFIPNVVSVVATAILFEFLFSASREGLLNALLANFGVGPFGWFSDPNMSQFSIALMGLWRVSGYNIIIFYAALQSVPNELYEAANVDGATPIKRWWNITLPMVRPIIMVVVMMEIIGSMRRFADVFMIGGSDGSPGGSLQTIVVYIYRNAFLANQWGIGSAAAFILFVIILILTLLNNRFVNKPIDE